MTWKGYVPALRGWRRRVRAKRRQRRTRFEGSNTSSWMATYADMVTLLLALFIMLFAFSNVDVERFRSIMSAFQGAIGILDGGSTLNSDRLLVSGDPSMLELIRR